MFIFICVWFFAFFYFYFAQAMAGIRPIVINKKGDLSTVFAISSLFMLALSEIIAYFAADK